MPKEKADRVAALRRRIAKSDQILKSLSVWPEPKRDTPAVRTAASAIVTPRTAAAAKSASPSAAAAVGASAAGLAGVAATAEMPLLPETASDTRDIEVAVLMIQHLRSWFDPKIPPVVLPEWRDLTSAQAAAAAAQAAAAAAATTTAASTAPASAAATKPTTVVPINKLLIRWCLVICRLSIESKDFDPYTMKAPAIRECVDELRRLYTEISGQVDLQQQELGDSYAAAKENVDVLRSRLEAVFDIHQSVSLANTEASHFVLALMQLLGATYWLYASLESFTLQALVGRTKEFVSALLALGTQANSDILTTVSCLRLLSAVNGIAFMYRTPAVAKDLSDFSSAIFVTVRALVMTVMQGGQKSSEYNMIVGSNLAKIKDKVSVTVRSRAGQTLSFKDEAAIADAGVKLLTDTLGYYEPQITQAGLKDVLGAMGGLPRVVGEFSRQCARARETTLSTWVPFMKSTVELATEVQRFCDGSLGADVDPDGVFANCTRACEQCLLQLLMSVIAMSIDNKLIPRHQLPISTRALCFALVTIADLCFLNS